MELFIFNPLADLPFLIHFQGKTSEKASKQIKVSPKFSVSSDDDGERHTKLSYLSGMSGLNRQLERSESVSTNESDTFDIIPSKKKNPSEVCGIYV